ncbi:3-dehydroquinate dehydratase [Apilactobacillus kunkeei]|nr:3-dehydroquinate dehydratase [Apilactobacillus kunkeei]
MMDVSKWKDEPTKIAVPITGENIAEISKEVSSINNAIDKIDLIEWRIDYLKDFSLANLIECNRIVRQVKIPLILTLRSVEEGGNSIELDYHDLLNRSIETLDFDILDVEIDKKVDELITKVHQNNRCVIASHHDLKNRLDERGIIEKFKLMNDHDADIVKVAIMPKNEKGVLALMQASLVANDELDIPIVSMSMGEKGMISRIIPSNFGSSISFSSLAKSSAPGQIQVDELKRMIDTLKY